MENNNDIHLIELRESTYVGDKLSYDIIQYVNTQIISKDSFFHFSNKGKEIEPLFTYYNNKWWVNRYVGEISFSFREKEYLIIVKPRFGELFLFELLEVIFNFKFAHSNHLLGNYRKDNDYIKRIIAKIWLTKLTKANKYGLPRTNNKKMFSGAQIKGKLDVRDSILPYKNNNVLISSSYEKTVNPDIASILYRTYKRLSKSYGLPQINKLPKNAIQVIRQLEIIRKQSPIITKYYDTSRLPKIYKSYIEVIDLSLSILSNKILNNRVSDKSGYSFFIDMAEIWEMYLLRIFQDKFSNEGWRVASETIQTYKGSFYSRKLIPDIVLRKRNKTAVFDAKYKLMKGAYTDLDRSDFFQIHTYKSYYNSGTKLVLSGLLYPLVNRRMNKQPVKSIVNDETNFLISGIVIGNIEDAEFDTTAFKDSVKEFLDEISNNLSDKR